jgi:hypothetical protein
MVASSGEREASLRPGLVTGDATGADHLAALRANER